MKLNGIEAFASAQIAAVPALAALGAARIYDPFETLEDSNSAIAASLKATGVSFEINPASAIRVDQPTRGAIADARFIVAIAESPIVSHTPQLTVLRDAVITAVTANVDAHETAAEFEESSEPFRHEQRYVLTILAFSKKVRTK